MRGHGAKFSRKMEEAVAALLTRSPEEAARTVGIGVATLFRWMKVPEFQKASMEARRAACGHSTARLQQATGAAVSAVLKIMVDASAPASTRLRAADLVLTHAAKATELEDIGVRVTALEQSAEQRK
jgi:hypothetical protein